MATYYCHHCDRYIDNDYHPGTPDPDRENELMCEGCVEEIMCETCLEPMPAIDADFIGSWNAIRHCEACESKRTDHLEALAEDRKLNQLRD